METIIEKAKELGELIANSEEFKRMQVAEATQNVDEGAQQAILEYNNYRESIMEKVKREKPDDSTLFLYRKEMSEMFQKLQENEVIAEYLEAKKVYEGLLNHVMTLVSNAGEDNAGCGGSCSSCSGCN